VGFHQAEHAFDVGQRLADFAVQHAEEIQRDVELDHEGIDQHDVAQRHAAFGHADRGAPHHQRDADGDDEGLADVQVGQRNLAALLCPLPARHLFVVAARLEAFVVEILHRFVVQQAVDGARVGGRIQLVHLAPELGAPVGHHHGEGDVDDQRDRRDQRERRFVLHRQDAQHEAHFDQRRQDGIQRVADQRADGAGAALDVARQAAGLTLEVKAQRQRMQMLENLHRDAPHGLLRDPRKHDFAQFGQQRGRKAQRTIGRQQTERHQQRRQFECALLHGGGRCERVDELFENERHRHVRGLGADQEGERDQHAPLVGPEVGEKALQGVEVPAAGAGCSFGGGQGAAGGMSHARIVRYRQDAAGVGAPVRRLTCSPAMPPRQRRPTAVRRGRPDRRIRGHLRLQPRRSCSRRCW
jgi:hypothetical protein